MENTKKSQKKLNKLTQITFLLISTLVFMVMGTSTVFAQMQLNYIHFDPAIVASGDEVDIVIQYQSNNAPFADGYIGNNKYEFKVELLPDDDLTREYILITDSQGDNVKGTIYDDEKYYKTFKVKVNSNAPAASYQFKLQGRWYENGEPIGSTQEVKFIMPVKKEGIVLDIASITTTPSQIRAGDKFVEVKTYIENVGEKDSKSVKITLDTSNIQGIEPSYADNNRAWVGRVNAGESKTISFYLNLDEELQSGLYNLQFDTQYMDIDGNEYQKNISLPFLVKPRPDIRITKVEGKGLSGEDSTIKIWVENIGETSAESVDIRILKQSFQPFEFDLRSAYVGELEPGESGVAIFDIKILDEAQIKEHDLKLVIRAKGDTDEGDDNIYTFNRRAKFDVTGQSENNYLTFGGLGLIIISGLFVVNRTRKYQKRNNKKGEN